MDIIFNCPKCEQELAVDSSGAGTEINCPSCSEKIVIPQANKPGAPKPGAAAKPVATAAGQPHSAMTSSAAAKVEMHLKVPVSARETESLIQKPKLSLEASAKTGGPGLKVKTIRHTDCIEVGHDKFDQFVTDFLAKVGEANVVSITPLIYTHLDIGSQKLLNDYAIMIVYRS